MAYTYNGILFGNKKEYNTGIFNNMTDFGNVIPSERS